MYKSKNYYVYFANSNFPIISSYYDLINFHKNYWNMHKQTRHGFINFFFSNNSFIDKPIS